MMKAAFYTLGCRVNAYESEAMAEKFKKDGYDIVPFEEKADVYVINTCTVTNMGDKKSRQMISRARRKNEDAVVAVVGCYSQIASDEVKKIEGVDVVLGTRNKSDIVYHVNKFMQENEQLIEVNEVLKDNKFDDLNIEEYQDKTRAFLKIQDGCNKFCSYCLIPYARGAICSKEPTKVLEEVNKLAEHGFKEIILSGIHIASYGTDIDGDWDLVRILQEINKIDGIERIRIGSIDPTFFNEETIKKVSEIGKMCPHFHLSLQSGCDETLKRMNRKYTALEYKEAVNNLRKYIKDVSITTDVIVGFPGETAEEFNETYNFLKEIKLSKMHIFKYSPRKGTKAASMKEQVNGEIKNKRSEKLQLLNNDLEKEFMNKYVNSTMDILYEQNSNENEKYIEGYTPNYIKVMTPLDSKYIGEIVKTKLIGVENDYMIGEEVK